MANGPTLGKRLYCQSLAGDWTVIRENVRNLTMVICKFLAMQIQLTSLHAI